MAENSRYSFRQVPSCECSGGEAEAVRIRTFSPRPARCVISPGTIASRLATSLLTPTRATARKLVSERLSRHRVRDGLHSVTALKPLCNPHHFEIAGFSAPVTRLRPRARVICMCARARTRMRITRGNGCNPVTHLTLCIYIMMLRVTKAVTRRLRCVTARAARIGSAEVCGFLAGRYAGAVLELGRQVLAAAFSRGCAAKLLPISPAPTARPGPIGALDQARAQLGENGGNPPFSPRRSVPVGRVVLEGSAQSLDTARNCVRSHQTVSQTRSARAWALLDGRWPRSAARHPAIPQPAGRSLRPHADPFFRNSDLDLVRDDARQARPTKNPQARLGSGVVASPEWLRQHRVGEAAGWPAAPNQARAHVMKRKGAHVKLN